MTPSTLHGPAGRVRVRRSRALPRKRRRPCASLRAAPQCCRSIAPRSTSAREQCPTTSNQRFARGKRRRSPARAGGMRSGRVRVGLAELLAREVVFDVHRVVLGAFDDPQQVGHRRDLLDLLLDEPLHELLGGVVVLLPGERGERVDLLAHALLLRERQRDGRDDVGEVDLRGSDARDDRAVVGVQQVLHHHHRVVALLERLAVEEVRQLRERLGVVVHRDRHVLLMGGELVADLLVELGDEAVGGHAQQRYRGAWNAGARRRRPLQAQVLQVGAALQALPRRLEAARQAGLRGAREQAALRRDRGRAEARRQVREGLTPLSCAAMATCLVTGGAGFLGSHLCDELLRRGHRVICADNVETGSLANIAHIRVPEFRFLHVDIIQPYFVDEPVDVVYHFASPASPIDYLRLPLHTLKVGSYGTHHTLGLAKAHRARFLTASTSEVYGDPKVHPQPESYWGHVNPIGPRGVYDEAKRYAEALTMAYHRQQGVDTAIVRIFNTYGPRMRPHDGRAVPTFLRQALQDRPITVFGDGSQTRSFCYVSDLVDGIIALAESDYHYPVNVGNPNEFTLLELAHAVIDVTGSRSEIVHEALPADDPQVRQPDISLAREILGWEPKIGLQEGLRRTVEQSGVEALTGAGAS